MIDHGSTHRYCQKSGTVIIVQALGRIICNAIHSLRTVTVSNALRFKFLGRNRHLSPQEFNEKVSQKCNKLVFKALVGIYGSQKFDSHKIMADRVCRRGKRKPRNFE